MTAERYQWYFVPNGSSDAIPVPSEPYNAYSVKNVSESGEYYCRIEVMFNGYVTRLFTERATVEITKKPVSVKASDKGKVYDAKPLLTNETLLTDGENADVTENYEITLQSGTLNIPPLGLTVKPKDARVSAGSVLSENVLYEIDGTLKNENLSLANAKITAKNADGKDVSFGDITKNTGTYTVVIDYSGFDGIGSENYQGNGSVTFEVVVYRKSSGGGSGESAFDDVGTDAWYYDAVTALANMGIIKGTGGNRFDPDGEITRAEFIAAAMRFTDIDAKGTVTFTDVAQDHWAAKEISSAASLGWISGNDDGTFSPDDLLERSSAAKIVNNMLGRKADIEYINAHRDGITLFDDVPSWEWYCGDVAEASNTHGFEKINGAESWK